MKLGFIGGGNMAQALMIGLNSKRFAMQDITVIELDANKRAELSRDLGVNTTNELASVQTCDVIVLAIKPQQLPTLAKTLAPLLKQQLVISIAAGIRLADLSRWLGDYTIIIRAMPNTPALIGQGIAGLFARDGAGAADRALVERVLAPTGQLLWVARERDLDAVTALSGSGPAYVFYVLEAMIEAGTQMGLPAAQARRLAEQTFAGAAQLAMQADEPVPELRQRVTSKGGTTLAAIEVLEAGQVKAAFVRALHAARQRAEELGRA